MSAQSPDEPQGRQLQLVAHEDVPVVAEVAKGVERRQRRAADRLLRIVETSAVVLVGGLILLAVSLAESSPPVEAAPTWRVPVREVPAGGQQESGGDTPTVAGRSTAAAHGAGAPSTTAAPSG